MTEFAYSGIGINPHHGTPRNPNCTGPARRAGRLVLRHPASPSPTACCRWPSAPTPAARSASRPPSTASSA
jgi:hypothetical protein